MTMFRRGDPVVVTTLDNKQHQATFISYPQDGYAIVRFVSVGMRNPTTGGLDTVHVSRVSEDKNFDPIFGEERE